MSNEALVSGQLRRACPTTEFPKKPNGGQTLRWIQEAMVLAYSTGGTTIMREELAATLESTGFLRSLGIEELTHRPEWYVLAVSTSEELDAYSTDTLPEGDLPLDASLPPTALCLLQDHAPIQECFRAFIESNDEIFTALFGAAWHALNDSPRMKLKAAHACAVTVERELQRSLMGQSETVMVLKRMAFELELKQGTKATPATVLFLGPPGSGKSLAARRFAAALSLAANASFSEPRHLMAVEMTKHVQWTSTADLIGDGGRQGAITAFVALHPNAFILINEFEKGHRKVLESFLPVLDQGFLPVSGGRQVDFRGVVFVFTSNLGAEFWNRPASPEENTLEVDPMELLSLAETPDERTEWYKTPIPKELLSRLGKGPVVLFRRHLGHHLLQKVNRTCRVHPEAM